MKVAISDYLNHGQQHAVPLRHLVSLTGLPDRVIRQTIERERRAGVPILSDNLTGYYLPDCPEETARFVGSMRHRAREILKTARAVEQGAIGGEANG